MRRRIAIATINRSAPSETFIRAHVSELPAEVHFLTGGNLPDCASVGLDGALVRLAQGDAPVRVADVARYLKVEGIEAVLAEYGPVGVAVEPACAEAGIPFAVHFHGYDAYRDDVFADCGARYPRLFARAAAILGSSRPMCRHLIELGAPATKVHHASYGYDPGVFAAAGEAGARPPRFLAVGRLVEKKDPLATLRAFARVKVHVEDASLQIAGDGPLSSECRALIRELGLEESVRLLGVVGHAEVAALMRQARVFVQHSHTAPSGDQEGTPVSLIEACASGLPVVSTRHAGIPDVIEEGTTGFLVDEGDVEGMARHMVTLARNDVLATRMGKAGELKARSEFEMSKSVARLWGILSGACLDRREISERG